MKTVKNTILKASCHTMTYLGRDRFLEQVKTWVNASVGV